MGSYLPKKFCSPFIKGQVIALDFGQEGQKFTSEKYLNGDFNDNRFWLILNAAEFNNIYNSRIVCVPLMSLKDKQDTYTIRIDSNKTKDIKVNNMTCQIVEALPDRIIYNNFGVLTIIKMCQIKSFSICSILNKYTHGWFLPSIVMDKVDDYNKMLYGFDPIDDRTANFGTINRMGYKVHYSHGKDKQILTSSLPMDTINKNSEIAKQFSNKNNSKPEISSSEAKLIGEQIKEPIKEEEKEEVIKVLPEKIMFIDIVPDWRRRFNIGNIGENINSIQNAYNTHIKIISQNSYQKYGVKIDEKITKSEIEKAMEALSIVTIKIKKKNNVIPRNAIPSIYTYILNSKDYRDRLYKIPSEEIKSVDLEQKKDNNKISSNTIDSGKYRDAIKSIFKEHCSRKKGLVWTMEEVHNFVVQYVLARENKVSELFDNCFHFSTSKQAYYLRDKYNFKFIKQADESKPKYADLDEEVARFFLADAVKFSDNILAKIYLCYPADVATLYKYYKHKLG